MNSGNVILHLPLEARNLAASLESDLSFSLPTCSLLPSSTEPSPKYLLYATPTLQRQSLPRFRLFSSSCLDHQQSSLTALPAAVYDTEEGGRPVTAAVPATSSQVSPLPLSRAISRPGTHGSSCSGPCHLFPPYTQAHFAVGI